MNKSFFSFLADLLFPETCYGCQKEGSYLCADCRATLDILESSFCLCDQPTRLRRAGKCLQCSKKSLDGLHFAVSSENSIARKILQQFENSPYVKELDQTLASLINSLRGVINYVNHRPFYFI